MLGSGFGSARRARPDVDGHSRTLRVWLPSMVVLSLVGALQRLRANHVFDVIMPLLVVTGSTVLLLQPVIALAGAPRSGCAPRRHRSPAGVALWRYFGAGSGICSSLLMLTADGAAPREQPEQ